MPKNEERAALRKEKLAELKAERDARTDKKSGAETDPDWFVEAQEKAATGDIGAAEVAGKKKKEVVKSAGGFSDDGEVSGKKTNIDMSADQFVSDDQGALSYGKQASAFRRGDLILIENDICKVQDMSTSKTGKHGSAKINFRCTSILTGKNAQLIASSTSTCQAPFTKQVDYSILSIEGVSLTLLNAAGAVVEGVKLPSNDEELGNTIKQKFEAGEEFNITVLSVMGHDLVTAIKKN